MALTGSAAAFGRSYLAGVGDALALHRVPIFFFRSGGLRARPSFERRGLRPRLAPRVAAITGAADRFPCNKPRSHCRLSFAFDSGNAFCSTQAPCTPTVHGRATPLLSYWSGRVTARACAAVIFLGSIFLMNNILYPLLHTILYTPPCVSDSRTLCSSAAVHSKQLLCNLPLSSPFQ
jgi:hypothetical protein